MPKQTFFNLPEEKQQRIIEAATEEFIQYKDNYDKSSVKRIAANADIAIGSMYKYFEDKNDLFFYLFTINKTQQKDISAGDNLYEFSEKEIQLSDQLSERGKIFSNILFHNQELFQALVFNINNSSDSQTEKTVALLEKDFTHGLVREDIDKDIAAYMYLTLEYLAYQYCIQHHIDYETDSSVLRKMNDLFFFGLYKEKK